MRHVRLAVGLLLGVLVVPVPAYANAGAPILALVWPLAWLVLVPVTLIEALIARHYLALPFRRACSLVLRANVWSALVGVPLAQGMVFLLSLGMNEAGLFPWFSLDNPSPGQFARVAVGLLFTFWIDPRWAPAGPVVTFAQFPAFFVSVLVEYQYMKYKFPAEMRPRVWQWSWRANEVSYGLLLAGMVPLWMFQTPSWLDLGLAYAVLGTTVLGGYWLFHCRRKKPGLTA